MTDPILPPALLAIFKAAIPQAMRAYQQAQAEMAHDAIVRQLKRGKYWALSSDKSAAVMWRYMRAAMEGAARRHLDLLAEALVNGAVDPEFAPDEFKRHADRLEGLSRNEILVLAAMIRVRHLPSSGELPAKVVRYRAAVQSLIEAGVVPDEDAADAHMSSLSRTGWLAPSTGYSFFGYVGTVELDSVARLVNFDAAAAREAEETG